MGNLTTQLQNLLKKINALLPQLQERLAKLGQSLSQKIQAQANSDPVQKSVQTPLKPSALAPLPTKVKAELLEAWTFVLNRLFPVLLAFVAVVVDKIDPPLGKAAAQVTSNPTVINAWQKLQATSIWQKGYIALAPIWRSLTETLKPITTSASIKPILAKPLGTFALVLVLTFLLSLRPHPVTSAVVVEPPAVKQVAELMPLIPPETGDAPISPQKVLVSSIQAQVTDISKSYGEALIDSVQTNFKLGRLMVQLSDAWYQLNPEIQEQLVTDLEKRSQALGFKKLFLLDTDQHLLARTPAIATEGGTGMIILRR